MWNALVISLLLGAEPAAVTPKVEPQPASLTAASEHSPSKEIGGAIAPAVMPRGTNSVYGLVGAPEVVGGYRQGFSLLEIEARAAFNYLLAAFTLEVNTRFSVYKKGAVELAPILGVGFIANSGVRYFDRANFGFVGLKLHLGLISTIRITEIVSGIILVDVPWHVPLNVSGTHFVPTAGAGAEIHLGGNISGVLLGQLGLDAIKEPLGVIQYRVGWGVRLGLAFRLF